jgi:hypothetical protein
MATETLAQISVLITTVVPTWGSQMDNFSLAVAQLELFGRKSDGWISCGHATGFFYKVVDTVQLITNWHVVTGVDPRTMHPVSDPLPSAMKIFYKIRFTRPEDGSIAIDTRMYNIPLYKGDRALWNEHSTRQNVDVVAIRLDVTQLDKNFANPAINTIEQENRLTPYPGMDCYVLGYPEGMIGPGRSPIWKRGSIATEPLYDFRQMPGFLIDSATREGMSGSPVIVRHSGLFNPAGSERLAPDALFGTVNKFIGIYSGHLGGEDPITVQLGVVWRADVLEDIVSGNTSGFNLCRV